MKRSSNGWHPPRCDSRTGAAHRQRGTPCQDASGLWRFRDGAGAPVQVLVVSDGHGGFRYDRSDVGSRLACHVALEQVHQALHGARTGQPGAQPRWQQWLAEELPGRIVERWRQEVLAHAQAHPRGDQPANPTFPYGATLGLLVLTPHWWGHSGLGDWDLVRIDADGHGELLSEEADSAGGGEATFSLCMEGAEHCFAARSALVPMTADEQPFQLLLSSDGIRKSCGSDADFFTLAHYLSELPAAAPPREAGQSDGADGAGQPSELSQALDHISSEGSGDDVSVAIARWGVLPAGEGGDGPGSSDQPLFVQPAAQARPDADRPVRPEALPRGSAQTARNSRRGWAWSRGRSPWLLVLAGGVLLLSLGGAGLGVAALWALGPFARPTPEADEFSAEQLAVLQSQVQRLCHREALAGDTEASARSHPALGQGGGLDTERLMAIRSSLNLRRSTFQKLLQGQQSSGLFLADPAQDPLGALIAWSFRMQGGKPQPAAEPPGQQADRFQLLPFGWLRGSAPAVQQPAPQLCPELHQALAEQWQRLKQEAGGPSVDNAQGR